MSDSTPGSIRSWPRVGPLTDTASVGWTDVRPRLLVTAPSDGSQFTLDSVQLVTGQALPGETQVPIAAVIVNGQPVDAVDSAGNFFTLVTVIAGQNVFTFTAVDALGSQTSQTLVVTGTASSGTPSDITNLQDVTDFGQFKFGGTTFNRRTNTLSAEVSLTNTSNADVAPRTGTPQTGGGGQGTLQAESLAAPALAAFAPLQPPTVALTNPDTTLPDGRMAIAFDTEIPATGLTPGATSALIPLAWSNPQRERFAIDLSLLTPANVAPAFASVPVTMAIAGQPYESAISATDLNGDPLAFHLEMAPVGMTLTQSPPHLVTPSSVQLHWTPGLAQLGVHAITLRVSDGHGGSATQPFSLRVVEPPPSNHGPLIVSRPATTVNLAGATSGSFLYPLQALDSDGDDLTFSLVCRSARHDGHPGGPKQSTPSVCGYRHTESADYDASPHVDAQRSATRQPSRHAPRL